ncbi:hypothetical protein Misp01_66020 [Microtetraspora sp. NBRC 13810]|uniref:maleylpyruvate isomerase family mycothiol-dependent enzyme n=1 Tax=Microtetraspora sp. NBRC 13810 TaxID=3030990 RepID=UPI0024A45216|nr:maleylpyruvate isomerase family mycothiol-dependent enzyme [Microtetraspora sp. NBRC 13810]GLW11474.1 hypothetical protein Misp01_66020 [Microtetraspora sp. NBRC 13810]
MDYVPHFRREVQAFEAAARRAAAGGGAPPVPSCPGWSVADLTGHLAWVHRYVIHVVGERLAERPEETDPGHLRLPADITGWPLPERAPNRGPIPEGLIAWFAEGAAALASLFASRDPGERVWTWSREQTTGFWVRMQTIEAALHRWDAENALGAAQPVQAELAVDAVAQNFEVMAPARRARTQAPPGTGERYRFRRTDGPGDWTVCFTADDVRLDAGGGAPGDVELAGTASDLMLFLWGRLPADRLDAVHGDETVLGRYFTLVPPG